MRRWRLQHVAAETQEVLSKYIPDWYRRLALACQVMEFWTTARLQEVESSL